MRKLRVGDQEKAWLRAIPRLPALSSLQLCVNARSFGGKELEGDDLTITQTLRVCACLASCQRLAHLDLTAAPDVSSLQLLAAVGAAVGDRLRYLNFTYTSLPPTPGAAVRALHTLVACYPHLEVLSLGMPFEMEASAAIALSRELLQAVPELAAPLCPALRKVRVDNNTARLQRHSDGRVVATSFVGSFFD